MKNNTQQFRKGKNLWSKISFIFLGLSSLVWFLARVIPKPSRAFYPCQRAAFPLASSFVIWLIATFGALFSFKKAKETLYRSKYILTSFMILAGLVSFFVAWFLVPSIDTFANELDENIEPAPMLTEQSTEEGAFVSPLAEVSITQSEKANVADLNDDDIEQLVREAVAYNSSFEDMASAAQTVVIKPNIVGNVEYAAGGARRFDPLNNGVITDTRVLKSVVKLIKELNSDAKIYILEGSADGGTTRQLMEYFGYNKINIPGVDDFVFLEERSGAYEEWDSDSLVPVVLPVEKALYANSLKPNNSDEFYLNHIYYNADMLISVPVLKNHSMTSVTGAVKNVGIGATPATIYAGRNDIHRYFENRIDHSNYSNLHRFIHDFYLCRPVDYVIMDGLQGTDYGPVAGHPTSFAAAQKNMRMILAGDDAVAVDAIASLIMGYDPSRVNHLAQLHNDTAGCVDPQHIRVHGPLLNSIKVNFRHNESTSPKYNDFSAPIASISNFTIVPNSIMFSLETDEPIIKLEVIIDGEKMDKDIVDDFENVSIDLTAIEFTDTNITILAYDKYLNAKEIKYKGTQELTSSISTKGFSSNELKIYPNPVQSEVNIKLESKTFGKGTIQISDLSGKLVLIEEVSKQSNILEHSIDISGLPECTYAVKVSLDSKSTSQLIVKN